MTLNEGYITLASGNRRYLDYAINLALSLKRFDPSRPVCLIHDETLPLKSEDLSHFDHHVLMPSDPDYSGCANKLRLYDYSPYERTFYIDSDCLVVKRDMDRHWLKFRGSDFNVAGGKRNSGHWYGFDLAEACSRLGIDYIVDMNSGALYFTKPGGQLVFETARQLYREARETLGFVHQNRPGQLADEPFFGAAMGKLRIEPISYVPEEGSIMISTLYAKRLEVDLDQGTARIEKPSGFYLLNRLFAKSWVKHSPTIVHFIGLKPKRSYASLASTLHRREAIGVR